MAKTKIALLYERLSREDDVRRFIREIREYASIKELDETILNRLIDKIIISVVEVVDGEKVQKIRIIYNFIGEIIVQNLTNHHPLVDEVQEPIISTL